jgi:hypothetical protein
MGDQMRAALFFIMSLAVLLTLNEPARANFLLEPYAGYYTGGWNDHAGSSYHMDGVTYGARVGYQYLGFMAGVDYMSGSWKDNASPVDTLTPSSLGAFIGYNFIRWFRIYGGYGFNSQLKMSDGTSTNTLQGTDFKFGLGFKILPYVSLNLEYYAATFTKDNSGPLSPNTTDNMFGLTLSLPFDLL